MLQSLAVRTGGGYVIAGELAAVRLVILFCFILEVGRAGSVVGDIEAGTPIDEPSRWMLHLIFGYFLSGLHQPAFTKYTLYTHMPSDKILASCMGRCNTWWRTNLHFAFDINLLWFVNDIDSGTSGALLFVPSVEALGELQRAVGLFLFFLRFCCWTVDIFWFLVFIWIAEQILLTFFICHDYWVDLTVDLFDKYLCQN